MASRSPVAIGAAMHTHTLIYARAHADLRAAVGRRPVSQPSCPHLWFSPSCRQAMKTPGCRSQLRPLTPHLPPPLIPPTRSHSANIFLLRVELKHSPSIHLHPLLSASGLLEKLTLNKDSSCSFSSPCVSRSPVLIHSLFCFALVPAHRTGL